VASNEAKEGIDEYRLRTGLSPNAGIPFARALLKSVRLQWKSIVHTLNYYFAIE
jgi:hypothetical protein